jgi:hypothetical protein
MLVSLLDGEDHRDFLQLARGALENFKYYGKPYEALKVSTSKDQTELLSIYNIIYTDTATDHARGGNNAQCNDPPLTLILHYKAACTHSESYQHFLESKLQEEREGQEGQWPGMLDPQAVPMWHTIAQGCHLLQGRQHQEVSELQRSTKVCNWMCITLQRPISFLFLCHALAMAFPTTI